MKAKYPGLIASDVAATVGHIGDSMAEGKDPNQTELNERKEPESCDGYRLPQRLRDAIF